MRALRVFVLTYLGLLVMLVALERMLVYPAPSPTHGDWSPHGVPVEDIHFASADGTELHGWFLPRPAARHAILLCHGNGEHVAFLADVMMELSERLDASVFAFDYRGYGKSQGKPFEQGVLEDGEAAQRWLAARIDVQPDQIVLYGRSLGGAVAVHLASTLGARALIVERTFHSMVDIGAQLYWWAPIRWLMRNRYPSADRILHYQGPLLQLHGTLDNLVPIESAKKLFAASPSKNKQFLEIQGLGHNGAAPGSFLATARELLAGIE